MRVSVLGLAFVAGLAAPSAQERALPPVFEAASVKPNASGVVEGSMGPRPGGYVATNVSVRELIIRAYAVRPFQVEGGPTWIGRDRFDIVARAPESTPQSQILPMLKRLLADRFKLVVRQESRERPVFALVAARADRLFGPALKRSTADCAARQEPSDQSGPCMIRGSFTGRGGVLNGVGQPLAAIATHLGTAVDRVVVDRTGMEGLFDFELTWSGGGATDNVPVIFTAIQEQLGLRLEPSRGPVDVLVIESVQRPDPD